MSRKTQVTRKKIRKKIKKAKKIKVKISLIMPAKTIFKSILNMKKIRSKKKEKSTSIKKTNNMTIKQEDDIKRSTKTIITINIIIETKEDINDLKKELHLNSEVTNSMLAIYKKDHMTKCLIKRTHLFLSQL